MLTEQDKKLRRNNLIIAIVLGIFALLGALTPFYYLRQAVILG